MVLIAAHSDTAIEESFENLINASVHPIADFYYKNPANNDSEALRRLNASRRAQLQQYQQIGLSAESGVQSIDQELLFRRVKGWLNKPQNLNNTLQARLQDHYKNGYFMRTLFLIF